MVTVISTPTESAAVFVGILTVGLSVAALIICIIYASDSASYTNYVVLIGAVSTCTLVCIAALAWVLISRSTTVGTAIGVLGLVCCTLTLVFGLQHDTSDYYYDGAIRYSVAGVPVGSVVLEFAIVAFIWRQREQAALEAPSLLERHTDSRITEFNPSLSPLGEVKVTNGTGTLTDPVYVHPSANWTDKELAAIRIPLQKVNIQLLLSRGGHGEVYMGTFNTDSVAVKMLLPETRTNVRHINALLAEVKLLASLEHPRIVRLVGVAWESGADLCVVTEFMQGGDLRGLLDKYNAERHPVGFDASKVKIALHMAHALTYLHSLAHPVLHRDLKSRNVLLTEELDAKLTDFGVSRERVDHTMTSKVGSSLWMAPEVLLGGHYGDKADVFSFGVLLSELDLHTLPYSHASGESVSAIVQQVAQGRLSVQFSAGALTSMVELGTACVSMDPTDRPMAAEALYRLQTILRNEM